MNALEFLKKINNIKNMKASHDDKENMIEEASSDFVMEADDNDEIFNGILSTFVKIAGTTQSINFDIPKFDITENGYEHIYDTKLGGYPYWPSNMNWPTRNHKPLMMLAQFNFDKLPHISTLPATGILQFFCSDDTGFFEDLENNLIVYHKNPIKNTGMLIPIDMIPISTYTATDYFFQGMRMLDPYIGHMYPDPGSIEYRKLLIQSIMKQRIKIKDKDTVTEINNRMRETLYDYNNSSMTCLMGYPHFTQADPREYNKEYAQYSTQLFQLNSNLKHNVNIGDSGILHYFVKPSDLKRMHFGKSFYHWDCF